MRFQVVPVGDPAPQHLPAVSAFLQLMVTSPHVFLGVCRVEKTPRTELALDGGRVELTVPDDMMLGELVNGHQAFRGERFTAQFTSVSCMFLGDVFANR